MKQFTYLIYLTMFLFFSSHLAWASRVAIVDSGTDFNHQLLSQKAWINPNEISENKIDDDDNGKVDDMNGWNFVDNIPILFFSEHLAGIDPIVYDVLKMITKIETETLTEEDKTWWNDNVKSLSENEKIKLEKQVNFYGQLTHSTHCSGIVALGNPNAELLSARTFPDQVPPDFLNQNPFWLNPINPNPLETLIELTHQYSKRGLIYKLLAFQSNSIFYSVAEYLHQTQMHVANYSLGIPLQMLAQKALEIFGGEPTEEEIIAETQEMFEAFKPHGESWIKSSPNTLFVIAAGNFSADNDLYPMFPANIDLENSITVAASNEYYNWADFSNYGKKSVHVAAPGKAIYSSVTHPSNNFYLQLSGTSMAAPFVTMVASRLIDINPLLKPADLKKIIIDTVDKKDYLEDKVASSGIINAERAYAAAEMSIDLSLDQSIQKAIETISDQPETAAKPYDRDDLEFHYTKPTPQMKQWSRQFVF